jgi:hypothetical protein
MAFSPTLKVKVFNEMNNRRNDAIDKEAFEVLIKKTKPAQGFHTDKDQIKSALFLKTVVASNVVF